MTPETATALLHELGHWAELASLSNTLEDLSYRSGQPISEGNSHEYAKKIMSGEVEAPAGLNAPKSRFMTGMGQIGVQEAPPTSDVDAEFDALWESL
jgi:hypothetical protein